MDTSNSITIRGDIDVIFAYAARVERWPVILPHYRNVQVLETGHHDRLVSMHCVRALGFLRWPCKWRARQELHPDEGRILFSHVAGPARGMKVEWLLERMPDGVRTTIRHKLNSRQFAWSRFYFDRIVGPLFVRPIAQQTLATIKKLVESEVQP